MYCIVVNNEITNGFSFRAILWLQTRVKYLSE